MNISFTVEISLLAAKIEDESDLKRISDFLIFHYWNSGKMWNMLLSKWNYFWFCRHACNSFLIGIRMYSTLIHCWSWAIAFLNLKCTPKVYNNGFVLTDDSDIVLLILFKWQRLSCNPCPNKCDSHVRSSSYEDGITRSLLIWNVTFQVWTRKVKLPLTFQIKLPTKKTTMVKRHKIHKPCLNFLERDYFW